MARQFVVVDCNKTRAAAERWRTPKDRRWKELGIHPQQRRQLLGLAHGTEDEFTRVSLGTLKAFAEKCERSYEAFQPDSIESYEKWRAAQRQRKVSFRTIEAKSQTDASGSVKRQCATPEPPKSSHETLDALHARLKGYYEVYHYATSRGRRQPISLSLLVVDGIDPATGQLKCEAHDSNMMRPYFRYRGRVTPIGGFLYWELRPHQDDAICYCCSYTPVGEKYPGFILFGLFLTISGDEKREYPIAVRAAVRFLGETAAVAIKNSIVRFSEDGGDPEHSLKTSIGGYLPDLEKNESLRPDVLKAVNKIIIPKLSNKVLPTAVPFALTAPGAI